MKDIKAILEKIKEGMSAEEIVLLLKENGLTSTSKKPITSLEEWADLLDKKFHVNTEEYNDLDEPFWDYENFFPNNEFASKDVGEGAWIKVKTDVGYNVYWAKRTKKQFNKTNLERKIHKQWEKTHGFLSMEKAQNKTSDQLREDLENADASKKVAEGLQKELLRAEMMEILGLQPYCVKYRVSKTKWEIVSPTQYELVSDIELYVKTIGEMGKTDAVTYKTLFTSVDKDIIFYLQSRGISRDMAVMMSKLKDCYFVVNVGRMMEMVIQKVA